MARKIRFREFFEATDIFGFEDKTIRKEEPLPPQEPISQFSVGTMMDYLSKWKIGAKKPDLRFMNEIRWGENFGAVRLVVSPKMAFMVQKLGKDLEGENAWITKKRFQLNRTGYGGYEEAVASEIFDVIKELSEGGVDSAKKEVERLDRLAERVCIKMQKVAQNKFIFERIKKVNDNEYQIVFSVNHQGVEAPSQRRVEQHITQLKFDPEVGLIKCSDFKIESPTGGPHEWRIMPADLEVNFSPAQDREEIEEVIAVHFKYF
jgi:hypothetical protein